MLTKKFPIRYQRDTMDCGAACLQAIMSYYGKDIDLEIIREKAFITNNGTSLLGIKTAAIEFGFDAKGVEMSIDTLKTEIKLPCILFWNKQQHYVVLYKIKKNKFYISDPGSGLMKINENTFEQAWIRNSDSKKRGICLLLTPTKAFDKINPETKSVFKINQILTYAKPYKKVLWLIFYCILFANALQFILPFLTQFIVDIGIKEKSHSFILLILVAQLFLYVSSNTFDFIRRWLLLQVSNRVNISMISDFLYKLTQLPIRFFDNKQLGDILQRIYDHSKIQNFLTSTLTSIIFSFFTLIIFCIVLAIYNIKILLIFTIGSFIYITWIYMFMKKRKELDYARFIQNSLNSSNLVEFIEGMKDIKLYNSQNRKRWEWEKIQVKLLNINLKSLSVEQIQSIGSLFINQVKNVLITYCSAKMVIEGEFTLGMMLSIQFIVGQLEGPINQYLEVTHSWQEAKLSLKRMNEIHNKENEDNLEQKPVDDIIYNNICFKNVSFQYGGPYSTKVLQNINLEIPIGKTTAIVGTSGSGKTTLLKMILGFYYPTEGEIFINNRPIKDIDLSTWRQKCGVILQDSYIFSDTIANNIAFSEETVNQDKLEYAVKMSNLSQLIENLPMGYNTIIGTNGHGLSQGQRQRILIARAIYKNPQFIFLDEATNSLDANNENEIMNNINLFGKNKTSIIIAHRFSTIKNADQIIVIEKGCIIEQGKHNELMTNKKRYYQLMKEQMNLN